MIANPHLLEKQLKLIMAANKCKTVKDLDNIKIDWAKVREKDPSKSYIGRHIWSHHLYTVLHIKKAVKYKAIEQKLVQM